MDKLVDILRGTLISDQNKEAEKLLNEMKKIYKFCPNLLQIAVSNELEESVRQAASISLKNNIIENWQESPNPTLYSIHEDDKHVIRTNIILAILNAPNKIKILFLESLRVIIRYDFPGRWSDLPNDIMEVISRDNETDIVNGYLCLLTLMKNYTYKKNSERGPINPYMDSFLEKMQAHMTHLLSHDTETSCQIKKLILKIYFNYCQYHVTLEVVSRERFMYWLDIMCHITACEVPTHINNLPVEDRCDTIWWNCKKWAVKTISSLNCRFCNPNSVINYYKEFSMWFLSACAEKIIRTMFGVCEEFSTGRYVSPRVISFAISNFEHLLKNASCWKYLKPHFPTLLKEVLFKLMSHSSEEDELWNEDPVEYIRNCFEFLPDSTPSFAATNVLKDACSKRKGVLDQVMQFVTSVLNSTEANSIHKDAAFRVIGEISNLLLKKENYAKELESFLTNFVIPVFQAPEGFRRARACWLVGTLCEADITNKEVLHTIIRSLIHLISNDSDLPVRVFAMNSLSEILIHKCDHVKDLVAPFIESLIMQNLSLLKESEVDELNDALQTIITIYTVEVVPLACQTMDSLKNIVIPLLEGEITDAKEYIIIGILGTIDSLVKAMMNNERIVANIEPIILSIINVIFTNGIREFYEEAYSLAHNLTKPKISIVMWQILGLLKTVVEEDADEITDMMPLLANYVTEDKPSLLLDMTRINTILDIVVLVLDASDSIDSYKAYGAKLLEMLLINYKGQIDMFVPRIIELVIQRLIKEIEFSEFRTMCLQVILAGLYYNLEMTLSILMGHNWPGTNNIMIDEFVMRLFECISDFKGIHDRKMFIIGISGILSIPADKRPASVAQIGGKLMPELVKMMESLKNTYLKAKDEDSDYDDDDDDSVKELDSDENEEDSETLAYLESLNNADDAINYDEESISADEFTTELETFETEIDDRKYDMTEFIHLYNVISNLNNIDSEWYNVLVSSMTQDHQQILKTVMNMAHNKGKEDENNTTETAAAATAANNTN